MSVKIMIVEDNLLVAEDIKVKLLNLSYDVVSVVKNGETAVMEAESKEPNLILMDVQLGKGIDGVEAAEIIRDKQNIPIVFLTAYTDEKTVNRAKQVNPYGYIVKPFDSKELQSTIEVALHKQSADQKIIQSKQWFETTLHSIGDGVIATENTGKILFMNPIAEALTGWTKEEAQGKSLKSIFQLIDDRGEKDVVLAMDTEETLQDDGGRSQHRILRTRDNTERNIAVADTPIRDEHGTPAGTVTVFRDRTKEHKALQALRESEETYRTLFKSASDAIFMIDTETLRILDANDRAVSLYGYSHAELLTMEATELSAEPASTKASVSALNEMIVPLRYHKRKDNTIFPVEITASALERENKRTNISIIRDISEIKEYERRLNQAQKMESIGLLAGGIAHDFNNILASIIGFTELALSNVPEGSEIEEDLLEVFSAGNRAKTLVRQILTFARQADEDKSPLAINEIAHEALRFLRSSLPATINIHSEIAGTLRIMAAEQQIHQIFINLCTNAAQSMEPDGGTLTVRVEDIHCEAKSEDYPNDLNPGDYVLITVSDTGHGIPDNTLNSIFDPFFTTKEVGKGTGIGLSVVHGIVESYDGKITVKSQVGQGTIFNIFLPSTKKEKASTSQESPNIPTGGEKILLLDDEPGVVKLGEKLLRQLGYSVTGTTDSRTALEIFSAAPHEYDLVLSDVTMPHIPGVKVIQKLKEIRKDIPVILCTGYSKELSEHEARRIGAEALLYKPFIKADIAQLIAKILNKNTIH